MSVLSKNVRIALFGMHQLQMQKAELEMQRDKLQQQARDLGAELDEKNSLIASNEELLKRQQEQLDGTNERLRTTQLDLQQTQAARDDKTRQLSIIQVAMDEAKRDAEKAEADRDEAQRDVAQLEKTKEEMMTTIDQLDRRIQVLNTTMTNIREGTVLFRVGEVLSSSVISGGLDQAKTREELSYVMSQTNTMIQRHLGVKDIKTVWVYIAPDEFNETVRQLQQAEGKKKLIRVIAAGNIMVGEPALVHVELFDNELIYHKGEVVYEEQLKGGEGTGNAELQVMRFLHRVNQVARAKGILSDPLTGNVGALTAAEMFDTIARLKSYDNMDVVVKAVTTHDVYTSGPLGIDIQVRPSGVE